MWLTVGAFCQVTSACMPACLVAQLCPTLCNPMTCSPPGSSVHGISQARILEWVAISFSRGSSPPRDRTHVSYIGRQILYHHSSVIAWRIPWSGEPGGLQSMGLQRIGHNWVSTHTHTASAWPSKNLDTKGMNKPQYKPWTPSLRWASLTGSTPCVMSHMWCHRSPKLVLFMTLLGENNGKLLACTPPAFCPVCLFPWPIVICVLSLWQTVAVTAAPFSEGFRSF